MLKITRKIRRFFAGIHLPVFEVSILRFFQIYVEDLIKTPVIRQASSVSWTFFLSLFPFLLFLLSIMPYLPHYEELLSYTFNVVFASIFPPGIKVSVVDYINEVLIPNIENINNLYTILLTLILGAIGTKSLINSFNLNTDLQRPFFKELLLGFFVSIVIVTVIVASLLGLYYSEVVRKFLNPVINSSWLITNLTAIIGFVSIPIFYFFIIAFLYWVGNMKIKRFREAIPGAIMSTILFVLLTYGFAYYVKEIATYNLWYGSIGTILLVMVWVNINIVVILFGNQFNLAVKKEKMKSHK